MLCLSGFELYSRWVPLEKGNSPVHLEFLSGSFLYSLYRNNDELIHSVIYFFLEVIVMHCKDEI